MRRHLGDVESNAVILAARDVHAVERAALEGLRNLADFDEMVKLSERLIEADRKLNQARRELRKVCRRGEPVS